MKVTNVLVEYMQNPLGLGIKSPRIMWNLEGIKKQHSFKIIYSLNGVKKETHEIVTSSMHYDFEEEFNSRDHVDFEIQITSEDGVIKSDVNSFEIGLLKQEDFVANWITGNYKASKSKRYAVDCFKKTFELGEVKKARLYISSLGIYEAHINNKRVGKFILAPGSTDYTKRVQYQTYDVKDLLVNGNNELDVELADGWYRGSIGARGKTCVFGKQSAVLIQLEIELADGKKLVICSDNSFSWSNDGPVRFADLKDGEIVDNNYNASYSGKAKILKINKYLSASNNTFIEEMETFEPARKFVTPNGKTAYEFKQNLAGIISFECDAHKGDVINLKLGEMLDEEGNVTLKNVQLENAKRVTPRQEIRLICKEGHNVYHGKFCISGFRYAELDSNVEIKNFKQIALYTSIAETSSFECSNELINIFVRNTLWSLKSNSADVPTDCPTRERMGWTGDSQVFFNTASYLTNYAAFARKHIVDVFDRQFKSGALPQIAPYNAEDWYMNVMNGSCGWADVGVLIPYRYFVKYGDDRLLKQYYEEMLKYTEFLIKRCGPAKGIYRVYAHKLPLSKENKRFGINTGQSYGEWAEPNDVCSFVWTDFCEPHPEVAMAYTIYILRLMNEIGDILGRNENKERFEYYADGITKAYRELNGKDKRFNLDTDRQAKLVRPLYMNLLDEETTEFARKRLIKALDNYGWRLGTGFLSTPFILDVLSSYDVEAAYKLLENEEMPGWLFMAVNNTGTIWEGWEGPKAQLGISSLNHYSKGAMVEWLFKGMCGINVIKENHFLIKPIIGGKEEYANASYQSIYGKVALSWKKNKDNRKIVIDFEIPSNTTALFSYGQVEEELSSGTYHYEF